MKTDISKIILKVGAYEDFEELLSKIATELEAKYFSEGYLAGKSDGIIEGVRECIRLCDEVDLVGADDCMDNIKEHFGV